MFVCAPWGAVGEFAASRYGVITRKQAAAIGLNRNVVARYLQSGHLREPLSGVLVINGAPSTWHQTLLVATLGSNAAGVAGFRSAAALHRFDGYSQNEIEIVLPSSRREVDKVARVFQSRVTQSQITDVDGIRCTNIARTLIDIASVDPPVLVAQAFESAWRNGVSLTWIRQVAESLRGRGQRGPKQILILLDQADAHSRPTESALELRLERILNGVPGLARQHKLLDEKGVFVARVDFAIPSARIAIEAHSRRFHFGPGAVARDEEREHAIKMAGWDVHYFGHESMKAPNAVRAKVADALRRANSTPLSTVTVR